MTSLTVIPAIMYNFEVAKKEKDSQIARLSLLEKKKIFKKKIGWTPPEYQVTLITQF